MRKIDDKRIDDNTYCWCPHIDLKRDLNGKHLVDFSSESPFLLKYYIYTSDFSLTRSYHDHLEIIYIYEGEGIFYYEDNPNVVKRGDIILISKDRMHLLNAVPNKRIKAISLYFQQEFIYRSGGEDLFFDYMYPFYVNNGRITNIIPGHTQQSKLIFEIINNINLEFNKKPSYYQLEIKNLLQQILLIIVRYFSQNNRLEKDRHQDMNGIRRLEKVFQYINNNLDTRITNKDLADIAFMSHEYLCRFFKKATGLTITDYIHRIRIDKAKELLTQSNLSITQIAFQIGFQSLNYFDEIFKRYIQLTPQEFRNKFYIKNN